MGVQYGSTESTVLWFEISSHRWGDGVRRAFEQVAATQLQACWEVFYPDKGSHAQNGILASLLNGDWNVAQKVKALDVPFLFFPSGSQFEQELVPQTPWFSYRSGSADFLRLSIGQSSWYQQQRHLLDRRGAVPLKSVGFLMVVRGCLVGSHGCLMVYHSLSPFIRVSDGLSSFFLSIFMKFRCLGSLHFIENPREPKNLGRLTIWTSTWGISGSSPVCPKLIGQISPPVFGWLLGPPHVWWGNVVNHLRLTNTILLRSQ